MRFSDAFVICFFDILFRMSMQACPGAMPHAINEDKSKQQKCTWTREVNATCLHVQTVWPSGLRRWLQAPVRKGVGSNPTAVIYAGT